MRIASPAAAMLILVAPLAACRGEAPAAHETAAPTGVRLTLRAQAVAEWHDVSAEVATVDQAQVIARIPGVLTTITVREGDMVKKGQPIGRIVDAQLGYQAGAYGAQAAAAQAQAEQADAELSRIRYLYEKGVYAKARLDQAEAASKSARAQIRAARAQQSAVGAVAGQGLVVAPTTGRVLTADVPAGSPVAAGMILATVTSGDTILRLRLPEALAGRIRAGARVLATGLSEGERSGVVARLYPSVQAGQVVADVKLDGIDDSLIGRRVAAKVEGGTRSALLVPRSFVTSRFGIDTVAVVASDGTVSHVPVQTAPAETPDVLEILSGVGAGDTLVGSAAQ